MEQYGDVTRAGTNKSAFEDLMGGGGGPAVKAADQQKTASVALAVDDTLKATLVVGAWRIRLLAVFSTANATMDFKFATAFTGTSTVPWYRRKFAVAGTVAGTDVENVLAGTGHIASTAVSGTTTGVGWVEIDMLVVVTVAGDFQFQWAQNTSDAGALKVLEGSSLEVFAA